MFYSKFLQIVLLLASVFIMCGEGTIKAQKVDLSAPDDRIQLYFSATSLSTRDTVFLNIFNVHPDSVLRPVTIHAVPADTSLNWDIFWYEADLVGTSFKLVDSTLGVRSDTLIRIPDGGVYAVFRRDTVPGPGVGFDIHTSRIAWFGAYNIFPHPKFRDKKADTLSSGVACNFLEIRAEGIADTIRYFNHITKEKLSRQYIWYSYNLYAIPVPDTLPTPNGIIKIRSEIISRSTNPTPDTTTFYLATTDRWGEMDYDTVKYYPLVTKAALSDTLKYAKDLTTRPDGYYNEEEKGEETMSVPVLVLLSPDSTKVKNALRYDWLISYSLGQVEDDTVFVDTTFTFNDTIQYIFRLPGAKYKATLTTLGPHGQCTSSETKEYEMEVSKKIAFPNFFSPDNDGINDRFRCYDVSLGEDGFRIRIYNRWGRMVHKYDGNIRNWEGWDGKIKDSNDLAPVGVYYYIVNYQAYEDAWDDKEEQGYFHLFRALQ